MTRSRPIRFGTGVAQVRSPETMLAAARRAEDLGFSTFALPDHFFMPYAPLLALQAIADVTTTLRVGQLVLAEGFRHPAVLAKELATLDVLSGGRVEVGIGAGWVASEFEQAGIPFQKPSVRIGRLDEAVTVIKGLFAEGPFHFAGKHYAINGLEGTPKPIQKPHPPIMIGGGGPKLLAVAARQADIIQVLPGPNGSMPSSDPYRLTARSYRDKVELIRHAAGDRFDDIELGTMLLNVTVTDNPDQAGDDYLARFAGPDSQAGPDRPSREELLSSPVVAIGSLEEVCDKLLAIRDEFGFSSFAGPVGTKFESLGPVIERLATLE